MDSIPISMLSDNKGYIDRQCPSENCLYRFKISPDDWLGLVSDERVYCPMCGYTAPAINWCTDDQVGQMREIVKNYALSKIQEMFDDTFQELSRSTRNNKYVKITYRPGERITFINNPIGQCNEWETDILCEKCGTHYSVIGSAFFCPCCGYNSAVNSYNDSLDSINRMIDSLHEVKSLMTEKYDLDSAESTCRKMLESSIGDMVSAFQKFACSRLEILSDESLRVNDFQIVDRGNELYEKYTGFNYCSWISDSDYEFMKLMFQRRHIIEHNNGIVDKQYIDKTNDSGYSIGQRIIVNKSDAIKLLDILRRLGTGIMRLPERSVN